MVNKILFNEVKENKFAIHEKEGMSAEGNVSLNRNNKIEPNGNSRTEKCNIVITVF